jgi:hypothetical protein
MTDIAVCGTDARQVVVHDERELIAAIRARLVELDISYDTLDTAALLPDGYTGKLLAPEPIKHAGALTLWNILGTLGYRIALIHDPDLLARFRDKLVTRERPPQSVGRPRRVKYSLTRRFLKKIGRLGAQAHAANASRKRAISEVRRQAALKRWHKPEVSEG